jgi:hypothetical protein
MNPSNPTSDQQPSRTPKGTLRAWLLLAMLAAPLTSLFAHPGHGHDNIVPPERSAHWFIEPEHAITWLLLGVLSWIAYRVLQQRTLRTEPVRNSQR